MRSIPMACYAMLATLCLVPATLSGAVSLSGPALVQPNAISGPDIRVPTDAPLTTAECQVTYQVDCYAPAQMRVAYGLPALYDQGVQGQGQTIAIVDSFGSPTIRHDLDVFDSTYDLPAPPRFDIIQPAGPVPPYDSGNGDMIGWAIETSLDVEWAHVVAPQANILLVETPVSETHGVTGFPEIVTAEKYVIDHGLAAVISQSFGTGEQTFATPQDLLALRGAYLDAYRHGITVLAGTADTGATAVAADGTYPPDPVVTWPASDPLVTAVGGTRVHLDADGVRTGPDTAWNDTYDVATQQFTRGNNGPRPLASGGGVSAVFTRPAYQNAVAGVTGAHRGVPDIALSAAVSGGLNIYRSNGGLAAGWFSLGGTSGATPMFAGIIALAAQVAGHPLGLVNPALYRLAEVHAPGIVDITEGNNTVAYLTADGTVHTINGYSARQGFDLVTGEGTINARWLVPELAAFSACVRAPAGSCFPS